MIALAAAVVLGLPMSGDAILARAKSVFRAHVRPAYVSYTLERRDYERGRFELEDSYSDKIWCRLSDRSALLRRMWRGRAVGDLRNQTIAFDQNRDPGPAIADVFERNLFGSALPTPQASRPPIIGTVETRVELDYRVTHAVVDGDSFDVMLEPKRDPARNRIDELWIDANSFNVRRARVRDHIYFGLQPTTLAQELDVHFRQLDGLPVIDFIHGESVNGAFEIDYLFSDVRLVDDLPEWYFRPASYGAHRGDAPS